VNIAAERAAGSAIDEKLSTLASWSEGLSETARPASMVTDEMTTATKS
jgi:hypothetical protein